MSDTITGRERIEAAVRLEILDRVPVAPLAIYFCAHYCGITTKEFLNDPEKNTWAVEQTFERLGGWDAWYGSSGSGGYAQLTKFNMPMRQRLPGDGLPDDAPLPQYEEFPLMEVEDYDSLLEMGLGPWYSMMMQRLYPGVDLTAGAQERLRSAARAQAQRFRQKWAVERQIPILIGVDLFHPVDIFSLWRTFQQFSIDMVRVPDKIVAACEAAWQPLTENAIASAQTAGIDVVWVGGWRTSGSFISPRQYQKFVGPYYRRICETLVAAGITPLLHFDANWTPMLRLLRELPAKKCILAVDQDTDLYQAKEILGDHMCLMGNVSPQLLTLGTVDQVVAECKHLIDVVGQGGGFILSSGCEVPYNARPENVAAMIDIAKSYRPARPR